MTSQKAKILLVDDHTLILQGIKHVVSQMPEIEKVYTASSGAEAMLLIDMQPFDIYLLDVELPDTNGFELIDKILQKHPEARILVNTMHEEIWILKRLTKASISGAILKSADINELTLAIQTILKGGQYLCKRFKTILNRMQTEEQIKEQLTLREMEVLQAIAKGFNTREIADLLHVSVYLSFSRKCKSVHPYGIDQGREIFQVLPFQACINHIKMTDVITPFQHSSFFQIKVGARFEKK